MAYDWYVNSDGTQCEVREAYVDADAFVEHAFHVREARDTLFGEFAYDRQMTIYGEPLPRLVELFDRVGWASPGSPCSRPLSPPASTDGGW